jgi:dephospho-CoA kinase
VIVIGLMGRIGSGKGTVANVMRGEFGFRVVTMGDLVREEVRGRGLEP